MGVAAFDWFKRHFRSRFGTELPARTWPRYSWPLGPNRERREHERSDEQGRCQLLLSLGEAESRAGNSPAARKAFLEAAEVARAVGLPRELAQAASGYGGRIAAPIFDSGLVVIGIISSSWGDQARGANRFYAFDGKTGQVVWIADPGLPVRSTYQSNPVIAVIGGQRLLITSGGDGALHAFKVRTGERVWSYAFSAGAANPSPVVEVETR